MEVENGCGDGDGGGSVMDILLRCDVVLATRTLSVLRCLGVELYKGPFTKVARVDLTEAVAADTGGHTGGLCQYHCSLNSLDVFFARPLSWEY
jgi:hypothetical protein